MNEKDAKRKYNYMENTLQYIIKNKVSLKDYDKKTNNEYLTIIVSEIINTMKTKSELFKKMYQRNFFGGSYYDGLKISKPDEYDLDLLFVLPKNMNTELIPMDIAPGFVKVNFSNYPTAMDKELANLIENGCLSSTKVLQWMEGVITKTLKCYPVSGSQNVLYIRNNKVFIKISKSGPAFTLKINGTFDSERINMDIDLVPCFLCTSQLWPNKNFRKNVIKNKTDFFVVPKTPRSDTISKDQKNVAWRLSFQEQEREMIHGYKNLKPVIKLLKTLRDRVQHKMISSYYIKTIFLWEVTKQPPEFWNNSISFIFIEMLQKLGKHLENRQITYYWNEQSNLVEHMKQTTLIDYGNRYKNIFKEIEKKLNDPSIIAQLFLNKEEMELYYQEFQFDGFVIVNNPTAKEPKVEERSYCSIF